MLSPFMTIKNKAVKRGLLISFEGGEGAGKSTQIRLLVQYFRRMKMPVALTLEPGGTQLGKKIRKILLDPKNKTLSMRAELLLYEADRAQHVDEFILPKLQKGTIVVTDRYADSSAVYQGICRNLGLDWTIKLNDFATQGLYPDLAIVLDQPEHIGINRARHRTGGLDRMEREKGEFHRNVRKGFLRLAKKYPKRIKVVAANQSIEKVHADILELVKAKL